MTGGLAVPDAASTTDEAPDAPAAPARALPKAIAALALVPALILLLDQVVKQLSLSHLNEGQPVRLLGGLIYLTLTRNGGAAYSLGNNVTWIFPIITLVVVMVIIRISRRLRSVPWGIALGLVLGGAFGNLADRLFRAPGVFRGHVVDMISTFDPYGRVFPFGAIFNIADSALFCGLILLFILEFSGRRRDGSREPKKVKHSDSDQA